MATWITKELRRIRKWERFYFRQQKAQDYNPLDSLIPARILRSHDRLAIFAPEKLFELKSAKRVYGISMLRKSIEQHRLWYYTVRAKGGRYKSRYRYHYPRSEDFIKRYPHFGKLLHERKRK